jgi:putative DNA primase/helicase
MTDTSMLETALAYAEMGLPVFPCNPKDKTPLVGADKDEAGEKIAGTGGFHKATTDKEQIKAWWTKWPTAMIGMTGGGKTTVICLYGFDSCYFR